MVSILYPLLSARYIGPPTDSPRSHACSIDHLARRPFLIDTRSAAAFLASHIKSSVKFAIFSPNLKRSRKPGAAGFGSIDALRQFIITDPCRNAWDALMAPGGDVIVYDEEMNPQDGTNAQAQFIAWVLLHVISSFLVRGRADYLEGGMLAARVHPALHRFIMTIHPPPTCWIRCKKRNILFFPRLPRRRSSPPFPSQRKARASSHSILSPPRVPRLFQRLSSAQVHPPV